VNEVVEIGCEEDLAAEERNTQVISAINIQDGKAAGILRERAGGDLRFEEPFPQIAQNARQRRDHAGYSGSSALR
jgi:hypothetical protein